jgi:RNA polymerase sigma-70 factor (ECF subfamily)
MKVDEAAIDGAAAPAPRRPVKPDVDDAVLVLRAQDGDPRAFEQLVRRYQQVMFGVAVRILGDRDEAEDVTQNAFIAAWRRLPEFRADAKFSTWMYRIVTNQALNQARGQSRRPRPADRETLEAASGSWASTTVDADPERHAQRAALLAAVRRALAALPDQLRVCWLLREVHERSYQEVADITEVSLDTARGRIFRARHRLAEEMSAWR